MRISDDLIPNFLDLATAMTGEEISFLKERLGQKGVNPMDVKKELASHLVRIYHGAEASSRAAEHFRQVVQEKEIPDQVEVVKVPIAMGPGTPWLDVAVATEPQKLAASKSEMRRLIQQGGFYIEQEVVKDVLAAWDGRPEILVRLGKRRYFRVMRG